MQAVSDQAGRQRAGFWRRAAAVLVDLAIQVPAGYLIGFTLTQAWLASFGDGFEAQSGLTWLLAGAGVGLLWLYSAGFESSTWQATPGKRLLGVSVSREEGSTLGFGRASLRFAAKLVSAALLGIGFLLAAGREKKALHDRLAGTLVLG